MSKFTVILLRPDYLEDDVPYGQNIYVAFVTADDVKGAIKAARKEVFEVDTKEWLEPKHLDDYTLVAAFDGYIVPVLFGWQE